MSPLRIGIVGARFAADLHATNYRPLRPARAELTAVCSRTREEAERFARRHAIHSNDITLGGVRNVVTAYLTNAVIQANINPNTAVTAYAPDAAIWGDEYITEKVETKAGWQYPSPDEDWMRGYPQELDDFVSAISERREPLSGALLAREVVEVIYAGYLSAATGRRVELPRP